MDNSVNKTVKTYTKKQLLKRQHAFMSNAAKLSAMKLTEMGSPTTASSGYREIMRRIKALRPDIGGGVRDTIAAFIGQGDEAKRLSKLVAEKKVQRKLSRQAYAERKGFYESREWRELRYMVLRRDGAKCACCGASVKGGAVMHVDHIKPRSIAPELELVAENLQVLCEDCNLGKSNVDSTDWRVRKGAAND